MVLSFCIHHLFKYPVETVIKTYEDLHLRQHQIEKVIENVERFQEGEMRCTKKKITIPNWFPTLFQKCYQLKRDTIETDEEIWCQPSERRYWIRSRNITWEDDASVGRVALVSPLPSNDQWTHWEDTAVVDFSQFGSFGFILELYLKRKFETCFKDDAKLMDTILKEI